MRESESLREELRDFREEVREEFRHTRRDINTHDHGKYITWAAGGGIFAALVVGLLQIV